MQVRIGQVISLASFLIVAFVVRTSLTLLLNRAELWAAAMITFPASTIGIVLFMSFAASALHLVGGCSSYRN